MILPPEPLVPFSGLGGQHPPESVVYLTRILKLLEIARLKLNFDCFQSFNTLLNRAHEVFGPMNLNNPIK